MSRLRLDPAAAEFVPSFAPAPAAAKHLEVSTTGKLGEDTKDQPEPDLTRDTCVYTLDRLRQVSAFLGGDMIIPRFVFSQCPPSGSEPCS